MEGGKLSPLNYNFLESKSDESDIHNALYIVDSQ